MWTVEGYGVLDSSEEMVSVKGDFMIIQGTSEQLTAKAASTLALAIRECVASKGRAVVAVPGGRSVAAIFNHLREQDLPWGQLYVFLLDERLVPPSHEESNYRLVEEQLALVAPPGMLQAFPLHPQEPQKGVAKYNNKLQRHGGRFDIVLASSGEDGHIASLFPHHPSIDNYDSGYILVNDAPKPPPGRMSASRKLISQADTGILLCFGSAKAGALRNILDTRLSVADCPAKIILELQRFTLLTDQEVKRP